MFQLGYFRISAKHARRVLMVLFVVSLAILPFLGRSDAGERGVEDAPFFVRLTGTAQLTVGATASNTVVVQQESSRKTRMIIRLGIREDAPQVIANDFTATVRMRIKYGPNAGSVQTTDQDFTISYKKADTARYDAQQYLVVEDAEYVQAELLVVPTNLIGSVDVRDLIYVENEKRVTRYYKLSAIAATLKPASLSHHAISNSGDTLYVSWTWQTGTGNNASQLEWSWVENDLLNTYRVGGNLDTNLLFRSNATRVDLPFNTNSFNIPLLYGGKGKIYYRVRPSNTKISGTTTFGPWSQVGVSQDFNGHNDSLNWQSTITYAEEGKHKAVVQYFDGTLRGRQTVTRDNVSRNVLYAETFYDGEGRPAIQVLPSPSTNRILGYKNNINTFQGQGTAMTDVTKYFDLQPAATPNRLTTPMDTTKGAAKYYSALNPEINTGSNAAIPKAEGFPYSYTRYTADGTGRIMAQSGVGAAFQMGKGHETRYYYGAPYQEELDGLFGTEVGSFTHYFKNMVQDANGQMSVSYVDMHGRTIATALAGESPANLTKLDVNATQYPNQSGKYIKRNLLSKNTNVVKNNSIEAINTLLVPARTQYRFQYALTPQSLQLTAGTAVCYDCLYDLEISISDESGETPTIVKKYSNVKPNPDDSCGTPNDQFLMDTSILLEPGSYIVRKSLVVNEYAQQQYKSLYFSKAIGKTEQQLIDSVHSELKTISGCGVTPPLVTCQSCIDSLGPISAYRAEYLNSIGNPPMSPELDSLIKYNYKADSLNCNRICDTLSHVLEYKRAAMLADMVPFSGQYARDFTPSGTDAIYLYDKYNIFSTTNASTQPYYKKPKKNKTVVDYYRTSINTIDSNIHSNPANLYEKLNATSKAGFEEMFSESWSNALLPYHPEYDRLIFAENNLAASYNWMVQFDRTVTYNDASVKGYIFTASANITDPLYAKVRPADKIVMDGKLRINYREGLSIWQVAYGQVKCKDILSPMHQKACISGAPKVPPYNDLTTEEKDRLWNTFKYIYATERDSSLVAYINSNVPLLDSQKLVTEKYQLHFPSTSKLLAQQAGNEWNWYPASFGAPPNISGLPGGSTPLDVYTSRCNSYKEQWRSTLENCASLAAKPNKDSLLNFITSAMAAVCQKGADAANPDGASNVAPNALEDGSPRNFQQIIDSVFLANGIAIDSFCNPFVIEFPKPYGKGPVFTKEMIATVDTCNCSRFEQLKSEAIAAGKNPASLTSFNQYLTSAYKDTLTLGLYTELAQNCAKLNTIACVDSLVRTPINCVDTAACNCTLVNISGTCYKDCIIRVCDTTGSAVAMKQPQPFPDFLKCGVITNKSCLPCVELSGLIAEFKAYYPAPYDNAPKNTGTNTHPDTLRNNILFEKFINYRTGYQYSWVDYVKTAAATGCNLANYLTNVGTQSVICKSTKTLTDTSGYFVVDSACNQTYRMAVLVGQNIYKARKENLLANFDSLYRAKCMAARDIESFTVSDTVKEYHYTLYYYDMAGNLLKTVPPAGVRPDFSDAALTAVKNARAAKTALPRPHVLVTHYRYNSLNAIIAQNTPDAKLSKFWYDRLGRLAVSQNNQQKLDGKYSYTVYDYLGRITEVGQKPQSTAMTQAVSQDTVALKNWVFSTGGTREQLTLTGYDWPAGYDSANYPNGIYDLNIIQRNLRSRVSYTATKNLATDEENHSATFYSYDIHGNVDTLLQDYSGVAGAIDPDRFKKIAYSYDLISGKVTGVQYQADKYDAFYHRYTYDAENRITGAETSRDGIYWENDAAYSYYRHGPLARTVLGKLDVQGLDYAYTLQGWLKGVNSTIVGDGSFDLGKDGKSGAGNSKVARDIMGFSLYYYDTLTWVDYLPIGLNNNFARRDAGQNISSLFNGNIGAMAVNNAGLLKGPAASTNALPLLYRYYYDQLNRLVNMKAFKGLNTTTNAWGVDSLHDYREAVKYDPNGNILSYIRNGSPSIAGKMTQMDSLNYFYYAGNNQLKRITDNTSYSAYYPGQIDINHQSKSTNYVYDSIGNLIADSSELLYNINWSVYGKIKSLSANGTVITYSYDAAGNRVSKNASGKTTLYVRDASGNVLAVYDKTGTQNYRQSEVHLYGSSRLGVVRELTKAPSIISLTGGYIAATMSTFTRGEKLFELGNHLGNVMATITDKHNAVDTSSDGLLDYYTTSVISAQDYYPFGMIQPGRSYNVTGYRYGFNGKENDNIKGTGNQQDYGMRIYDPRVAKFLSVDPLIHKYPELTPYQFASNMPICAIDLDGGEAKVVTTTSYSGRNGTFFTSVSTAIDNNRKPVENHHYEVHKQITFVYEGSSYRKIGQKTQILSDNLVPDKSVVLPARKVSGNHKLSKEDYSDIGKKIGVEPAVVAAVVAVESSGSGFTKSGNVVIRFEGHQFKKFMNADGFDVTALQNSGYSDILYGYSQRNSYSHGYKAYNRALDLNPKNAMLSTSYGAFQIMGFNFSSAGYKTVEDFVRDQESTRGQVNAFMNFVSSNPNLLNALKDKDFTKFASSYNGPDYKTNNYDKKMQENYENGNK